MEKTALKMAFDKPKIKSSPKTYVLIDLFQNLAKPKNKNKNCQGGAQTGYPHLDLKSKNNWSTTNSALTK
jgi:hypothetical protein